MRLLCKRLGVCFLLPLLSLCFSQSTLAAAGIGVVKELNGTASATSDRQRTRVLRKGSPIYQSDVISTGEKSSIKLLLKDNSRFELGPDASLKASKFTFNKTAEDDSVAVKLLKGTFRFFSGLIAKKKPRGMRVSTSVATIGIRGTHVVGEVSANSATIILMEPEEPGAKTGIDVSNEFGSVSIDEPGYGTEIPDEFSPPSPPRRMRLQTINNLMRSMQSIQRINVPRPRMPH